MSNKAKKMLTKPSAFCRSLLLLKKARPTHNAEASVSFLEFLWNSVVDVPQQKHME